VATREVGDLRNHCEPELLVEALGLKAVGGENELAATATDRFRLGFCQELATDALSAQVLGDPHLA
jgi:hypothetical protein